jgi:hypothetical protein
LEVNWKKIELVERGDVYWREMTRDEDESVRYRLRGIRVIRGTMSLHVT